MKRQWILATAAAAALTVTAGAMAQMSVEDQIKNRQSAYTFAAWNMGKIKAQAVDGTVEFNRDQMLAAANAIAAVANSGMGTLFGPGTDSGTGWKETRLKSNFFEETDKVREVAVNFITEANKLQEVAQTGERQAIAAQFARVGQTCKACHDNFRAD